MIDNIYNVNFRGLNLDKLPKNKKMVAITPQILDTFEGVKTPALKKEGAIGYIKSIVFKSQIERAKEAFKNYQHNSFMINSSLRYDRFSLEEAYRNTGEEYFKRAQYFIDKGFDLLSRPLATDTTVYRLVFKNDSYAAKWNIGDIVEEKAFISTSYLPKTRFFRLMKNTCNKDETPVNIKILLPKGTKVIKEDGPMKEILIRYGSSFKVVDFDPNTNTYIWQFLR